MLVSLVIGGQGSEALDVGQTMLKIAKMLLLPLRWGISALGCCRCSPA